MDSHLVRLQVWTAEHTSPLTVTDLMLCAELRPEVCTTHGICSHAH